MTDYLRRTSSLRLLNERQQYYLRLRLFRKDDITKTKSCALRPKNNFTKTLVKGSEEVGHSIVDLKPRLRGLVVEPPRKIDSVTIVGNDQRCRCQTRIASVLGHR